MSPRNRPGYENGKQLQFTIIKITESKFIHRLNVSGSTGPGEAADPLAPPATYGSDSERQVIP